MTKVIKTGQYFRLLKHNPEGFAFMEKLTNFFSMACINRINAIHEKADEAKSIRELWLQGELFLCDRKHIQLNTVEIGEGGRADLSYRHAGVNGNLDVVAEIKWISSSSNGPLGYWRAGEPSSVGTDMERLSTLQPNDGQNPLRLMIVIVGLGLNNHTRRQENRETEMREIFLNQVPEVEGLVVEELEGILSNEILSKYPNIRIRIWKVHPAN